MTSYHKKISLKLTEHVYRNYLDNGDEYYRFRFGFESFGSANYQHTTVKTPRYLHFSGLVDEVTEKKEGEGPYIGYVEHVFTEYFFYPLKVFHMVDEDDPPGGLLYYD